MAASQKILDFFNRKTFENLIGTKSNLSIDFDPVINAKDGIKFNNKGEDSLKIDTIGLCKFTHIVAPLSLINSI